MIKDKNWIKHFLESSTKDKIIISAFVLVGIFASVYFLYILVVFSSFSLSSIYNNYLEPLGFDYASPFQSFLLLFLLELVIFSILPLVFKRKINWYLFSTLAIILFLFIFGLSFITFSYKIDLPSSPYWDIQDLNESNELISQDCNFSRLDCKSVWDKQYFVSGDEVYCQFVLSDGCDVVLKDFFDVRKVYLNSKNESKIPVSLTEKQVVFQIEIERELKALWVIPYFSLGNKTISPFYLYWEFENVYSEEEYNRKQSEKTSLLIALISLSIFSSVTAMNSLKQMLERNFKEKNSN